MVFYFFNEKLYNLEVRILAVTKILRELVNGCSSLFFHYIVI